MIGVDYFLYDNRTVAQWGRDWGIKAATGALASRADLKAEFNRYCGTLPSEHGRLSGFGEAIGGIRSRNAKGYLLCVTLETADLSGRPSWAVFGLWCPDSSALEDVLSGGPASAARSVLNAPTPPAVIHMQPGTLAIRPSYRKKHPGTLFRRFERGTTEREVTSLLLGAIHAKTTLPNILGITATPRLPALAEAGFDRVYSHPLDDRTESALSRHLSSAEADVEELWPPAAPVATLRSPSRSRHRGTSSDTFLWALVTAALVFTVAFLVVINDISRDFIVGEAAATQRSDTVTGNTTRARIARSVVSPSPDTVLQEIGERMEELKKLDPQGLRDSSGYRAAHNIAVIEARKSERERVRAAYASLIEARERIVKQTAYFFADDSKAVSGADRLQRVSAILKQPPLASGHCLVLRNAFGFEFESRGSVVRHWCDALSELESGGQMTHGVGNLAPGVSPTGMK